MVTKKRPVKKRATTSDSAPSTAKRGAKSSTKSSSPKAAEKAAPKAASRPSRELSQQQRLTIAFILLGVALYIGAIIIFYYMHWYEDQDILRQEYSSSAYNNLANPCGKHGVLLAHLLVSRMFGVGTIAIPMMLVLMGLRAFGVRWSILKKNLRIITITMLGMILISVSCGFVFGTKWDIFGTGLGGEYGIYAGEILSSLIGPVGTYIVLAVSWLIIATYINVNTVLIFKRMWSGIFGSNKRNNVAMEAEHDEFAIASAPVEQAIDTTSIDSNIEAFLSEEQPVTEPAEQQATTTELPPNPFKDEDLTVVGLYDTNAMENSHKLRPESQTPIEDDMEIKGLYSEPSKIETTIEAPIEESAVAPAEPITAPAPEKSIEKRQENSDLIINPTVEEKVVKNIDNSLYDPTRELSNYQLPPVELLEDYKSNVTVTTEEIIANKNRIKQTLENFGIKIDQTKATVGPTVTLYEIIPAAGVRISKIKNLEDDIALSLSALGIRIIAPIPGKGTIGIEVPNKDKKIVSMYSVVKSAKFQESKYDIPIVLGKTIQDETFVVDLAKTPHLLVAGATGQGKSVGLNAIITSILYRKHPSDLKFVLIDPKKVELTLYAKLEKHFMAKMPDEDETIITDTKRVIQTLNSLCKEMDNRYGLFNVAEVRNLKDYNHKFTHRRLNPNNGHRYMPYIVVVIDEFADLIMTAGREIELPIARLAQLGRAAGMHLVIATQRPTTNIITGMIKANFPARIAFRVTSMIDSRTILDQPGANQLIGRGDMLVSTGSDVIRVQCAFADTPEVERVTEFISNQQGFPMAYELPEPDTEESSSGGGKSNDAPTDDMFKNVAYYVVQNRAGSTSAIQRRFSIGYNRAGRITDQLESAGIVGRAEGSKPREVLVTDITTLEGILNGLGIK